MKPVYRRVFISLLGIALYRIGRVLPLPGVDVDALAMFVTTNPLWPPLPAEVVVLGLGLDPVLVGAAPPSDRCSRK